LLLGFAAFVWYFHSRFVSSLLGALAAVVPLDHTERKINAGGNSVRRSEIAVFEKPDSTLDLNIGELHPQRGETLREMWSRLCPTRSRFSLEQMRQSKPKWSRRCHPLTKIAQLAQKWLV
jgi:hypothetical protein